MGTEPIEALQVALKQVASQVALLGLNSIIDSNGTHWIASSIANANAIAGCEWALKRKHYQLVTATSNCSTFVKDVMIPIACRHCSSKTLLFLQEIIKP